MIIVQVFSGKWTWGNMGESWGLIYSLNSTAFCMSSSLWIWMSPFSWFLICMQEIQSQVMILLVFSDFYFIWTRDQQTREGLLNLNDFCFYI